MLDALGEHHATLLLGAFTGAALGLAARLGRFCTLGALEDWQYGASATRAWMWAAAVGAAVLVTSALGLTGGLDTAATFPRSEPWNPTASVVGGLLFGYGMAIAGNCGLGALARLGGGDLRSLVILLVMGLAALAALSGPLASLRLVLFPPGVGLATTGLPPAAGLVLGPALLAISLRGGRAALLWGGLVGLAVAAGWGGTAWIAREGFAALPPVSHSFAAPLGDTMLWLMTASGTQAGFGVGSVGGVLAGAVAGSLIQRRFRWEACDDARELRRQIGGAALMGVGAVVALGCSVGQGLSAFAVLAWSAPVTLGAIALGGSVGLARLVGAYEGMP